MRKKRCAFYTNIRFPFLGFLYLKHPFPFHLAFVQQLYRATGSPECVQISTGGPIRRCTRRSSLQARTGRCAFCTYARFPFLGFPYRKLPSHMHLALVQPLYRATGRPECAQISTGGPVRSCTRLSSLQARTGMCAFCNNARSPLIGFPYLKLPFHMHLALAQPLYRATGRPECAQISTGGPILRCTKRSSFQARTARYAFSTNARFPLLGFPYLKLPFHMHLALVQPLIRATGSPECAQISTGGHIRRCTRRSSLQARTGRCAFYTNRRLPFLGFSYLKFPFHMHLALVQPLYRATGRPECAQISTGGPIRRCTRRSSLQARTGRCAFSTNARFQFLGFPYLKLPFQMLLALVQPLYRATGRPECAQISTGGPIRR